MVAEVIYVEKVVFGKKFGTRGLNDIMSDINYSTLPQVAVWQVFGERIET